MGRPLLRCRGLNGAAGWGDGGREKGGGERGVVLDSWPADGSTRRRRERGAVREREGTPAVLDARWPPPQTDTAPSLTSLSRMACPPYREGGTVVVGRGCGWTGKRSVYTWSHGIHGSLFGALTLVLALDEPAERRAVFAEAFSLGRVPNSHCQLQLLPGPREVGEHGDMGPEENPGSRTAVVDGSQLAAKTSMAQPSSR